MRVKMRNPAAGNWSAAANQEVDVDEAVRMATG